MKSERHRKILEIINKNDIETQEELAAALIDAGFNVTQATVSRDIKMLNLTKMVVNGHKKYVVFKNDNNNMNDKYIRVLRDGFSDMDMAQNILVIKTVRGWRWLCVRHLMRLIIRRLLAQLQAMIR